MKKISRMWRSLALAAFICTIFTLNARAGYLYVLNVVSGSEGRIYGFETDADTGALTALPGFPFATGNIGSGQLMSEAMAVDSEHYRLYVLNDGPDTLSVYSIDPGSGSLAEMPYSPLALTSARWCTVAVHPSGSPVVVGGTSTMGIASSFYFSDDWAFPAAGNPFSTGTATPFSSTFSRDGSYYYAGGFSLSAAFAGFSVDAGTGSLAPLPGSPFNSGGSRPAGFSTDNDGRLFAVETAGRMRVFTTTAGMPSAAAGNPFSAVSGAVDTVMHPDGDFIFVTGRTANQVTAYHISGSGSATEPLATSTVASGGTYASIVTVAQSGRFVYVANSISRNIGTAGFDRLTGEMSLLNVQPSGTAGSGGALAGMALFEEAGSVTTAPGDLIQQMIDTINGYDPPLQRGIARALIAKLEDALGCLEAGDIDGAKEKLRAFMYHVRAQSGKHLSPEVADELTNAAMNVVAAIDEP
jgi:6-phosphogluconolactonase (cycloisomerase 2 family)